MQTPAKVDLPPIWRGCDWGPVTLYWKDANGDPINLSGWYPRAKSLNYFLGAALVDNGVGGVTTMTLSRDETDLCKLGVESWDWVWEHYDSSGNLDYRFSPFLSGKIEIKEPTSFSDEPPP